MKKTIVTLTAVSLLICAAAAANTRVIARVHAGDLIEIEGGWTTRLTGISATAKRVHRMESLRLHQTPA